MTVYSIIISFNQIIYFILPILPTHYLISPMLRLTLKSNFIPGITIKSSCLILILIFTLTTVLHLALMTFIWNLVSHSF
jgi:hypothetical protein